MMTKKKHLSIKFLFVLSSIFLSSCKKNGHTHEYGNWEVIVLPTATTTGTIEKKCTSDDDTISFELPVLNTTDYSYKIVQEATCSTNAIAEYTYVKDEQNITFKVELTKNSDNHAHITDEGNCSECGVTIGLKYDFSSTDKTCYLTSLDPRLYDENGQLVRTYHPKNVTIPGQVTYNGEYYKVLGIKSLTFNRDSNIESVTIQEGVNIIDDNAFFECPNLKSISIPASVNSISEKYNCAFFNCPLIESIKVDENNKTYDSRNDCNAIIETETNSLLLGSSNTTIPNTIENIGNFAFYGRANLTSVVIPTSVTSIGSNAFTSCDSLTSIKVDENNEVFDSRDNCNAIIFKDSNILHTGCKTTIIPDSVKSIKESAFAYCHELTEIKIPSSVTKISQSAFFLCTSLKSIDIPDTVTTMDKSVFQKCSSLQTILLPAHFLTSKDFFDNRFLKIADDAVFYIKGTVDEIDPEISSYFNRSNETTKVAYYSEEKPTNRTYYYWHYVNNVPELW